MCRIQAIIIQASMCRILAIIIQASMCIILAIIIQACMCRADQEKILALLASWLFHQKPTAKCGNISIEKVLYITKKQALKAV